MAKRNVGEDEKLRINGEYKEHKKELRKLIRASKKEQWDKLCEDLNRDVWGDGYKIAIKGIKNIVPYDIPDREKMEAVKKLFSFSEREARNYRKRADAVQTFTAAELKSAVNTMKTGKAPVVVKLHGTHLELHIYQDFSIIILKQYIVTSCRLPDRQDGKGFRNFQWN
ncbi:hypothetical protein QE152_g32402 [Popillia japonica]|uniref:Uncharacterized protein n=1 Tax=Popillia japonica TaxID=7064 RepID=A0AAW1IZF1_POPJA